MKKLDESSKGSASLEVPDKTPAVPHPSASRSPHQPPVILLAGPTAVGKTDLSLKLARIFHGEIINADSLQVFRCLDVGTAKPSQRQRRSVPHHLIDIVNPNEPFDAARYMAMARPIVDALRTLGKVPLVVGGTGLYMKALLGGLCPGAPADATVREQLREELSRRGLAQLYEELRHCDRALGSRLHPNDRQRILRALEVYRITGKPLSTWQAEHGFQRTLYPSIKLMLYRERDELYQRINRRAHVMLEQGFVEEVRGLLDSGWEPDLKPMLSLGYKQIVQYLQRRIPLKRAIGEIQRDTRRYAKRQLTWFRNDRDFHWFHADDEDSLIAWIRNRLSG